MKVKSESEVSQSCPTLSDPMDCSLTGSSVHGIFQARVLEWGAIAFSEGCSNYHTIALISHASKLMLKILQARLQQYMNFQMFKLNLEKPEEPEIKLSTSAGSQKKQESSRKTSTFALLTTPEPLTVWITTSWKILKEMEIPDHLTCFLRNLYAGQEGTVRAGHETTD